jgi:hypothetical protein
MFPITIYFLIDNYIKMAALFFSGAFDPGSHRRSPSGSRTHNPHNPHNMSEAQLAGIAEINKQHREFIDKIYNPLVRRKFYENPTDSERVFEIYKQNAIKELLETYGYDPVNLAIRDYGHFIITLQQLKDERERELKDERERDRKIAELLANRAATNMPNPLEYRNGIHEVKPAGGAGASILFARKGVTARKDATNRMRVEFDALANAALNARGPGPLPGIGSTAKHKGRFATARKRHIHTTHSTRTGRAYKLRSSRTGRAYKLRNLTRRYRK